MSGISIDKRIAETGPPVSGVITRAATSSGYRDARIMLERAPADVIPIIVAARGPHSASAVASRSKGLPVRF
jgi:hypothetical protein